MRSFEPFFFWVGPERRQFVMFVIAAGLSVPVNLAARVLFSLIMSFEIAVVLSHICGLITAYTLTKLFVFERSGRSVRSELLRFTAVNLASLAQTWVVAVGLVEFVFPAVAMTFHPEFAGHFIGLATSSITSYVGHKRVSFARREQVALGH